MSNVVEMPNDMQLVATDKASSMSLMLDAKTMESAMTIAKIMATSKVTVPVHLRGQEGDCMAIVLQAMNWGMNPFAVAQKTHIVNGTLGYEAQLVNSVLQSQGVISGAFNYEYQGEGAALQCRVGAIPRGKKELIWGEWLNSAHVTTKNSPLWKTNPKQQMGYLQVKNWARAYYPSAIMGVYTTDEIEEIPKEKDVTSEGSHTSSANKEPSAPKYFTDDEFKGLQAKFKSYVDKGKPMDDIYTFIESKGTLLTQAQKDLMAKWRAPIEGELVDAEFVGQMNDEEMENK